MWAAPSDLFFLSTLGTRCGSEIRPWFGESKHAVGIWFVFFVLIFNVLDVIRLVTCRYVHLGIYVISILLYYLLSLLHLKLNL